MPNAEECAQLDMILYMKVDKDREEDGEEKSVNGKKGIVIDHCHWLNWNKG